MTMARTEDRFQYLAYIIISAVVILFTGILYFSNAPFYRPYFGEINPLILTAGLTLSGFFLLLFLNSHGGFHIFWKGNYKGLRYAVTLPLIFAVVIVLVDVAGRFPEDINVPFPEALLFYPAIAFVVEVLFHLFPLTLLMPVITHLFRNKDQDRVIWGCIFIVALLEPVFQAFLATPGTTPVWVRVYVPVHIFLINLVQLVIFRRYDFFSMYLFRVVYYLLWHILWGHIRLQVLF